jgi:arylsulfatase
MSGALVAAVAVWMSTASAAPQTVPDFSGRWATEAEPGRALPTPAGAQPIAPGDMGSGWGSTITITQQTQLVVEYPFFGRGDMQPPLKFVYALDGSETRNTVMMGRGIEVQVSRAVWDGPALVITTTHTLTDPVSGKPLTVDVKRRLTLESPTSLVVEVTRDGVLGGKPSTTRTIYRKI